MIANTFRGANFEYIIFEPLVDTRAVLKSVGARRVPRPMGGRESGGLGGRGAAGVGYRRTCTSTSASISRRSPWEAPGSAPGVPLGGSGSRPEAPRRWGAGLSPRAGGSDSGRNLALRWHCAGYYHGRFPRSRTRHRLLLRGYQTVHW